MGLGNSQEYYEPQQIRPSSLSRHGAAGPGPISGSGPVRGVKRRRRRIFRRSRQAPTTIMPAPPVRHHSPHRHHHPQQRHRHYSPAYPAFGPLATGVPSSLPMSYQNFTALPYTPPQSMLLSPQQMQPMMMPQQMQPMVMPQQMPQSYPMMAAPSRPMTMQRFAPVMLQQNLLQPQQQQPVMMPQYMPQQQHVMMPPQESPQAQAMRISQQVSASIYGPYASSPYGMSTPYSAPYAAHPVQQQPQVQPLYNNIGASVPAAVGPVGPFLSPNRPVGPSLGTDWTGGGKISPGFLGPPL